MQYSARRFMNMIPGSMTPQRMYGHKKPIFPGTGRAGATSFAINNLGYVSCGFGLSSSFSDTWQYDPIADSWTPKASFPSGSPSTTVAFTIDTLAYNLVGNQLWVYNASSDTWTQKPNYPGPIRALAASFVIGNSGFVATGEYGGKYKDIWEYNLNCPADITHNLRTNLSQNTFCGLLVSDTLKADSIASSNTNYKWFSSPDNITYTLMNNSDSFRLTNRTFAQNTYIKRVVSLNANCFDTSLPMEIIIKPAIGVPSISVNSPVCLGQIMNLTATDSSIGIAYQWSGPGNFSTSTQNPGVSNIQYADSGKYVLTVTKNGCVLKDSLNVPVQPVPSNPLLSVNGPICAGDTLMLSATDSTAGITYVWTGPHSFTNNAQNPDIPDAQTINSGTYVCKALWNGCYSYPISIHAVVNTLNGPTATISSSPSVVVAGQSATFTASVGNAGPAPTYQWYHNSVAIPGATANPYTGTLAAGDWIAVIVHGNALCALVQDVISNDIVVGGASSLVGTSPGLSKGEVTVRPNPASSVLYIDAPAKVNVDIMSIEGKVILRKANVGSIDISDFANGIYFVRVYDADGVLLKVEKLVKE